MSSFKIGDRVRIIIKEYENNYAAPHYGICGEVAYIHNSQSGALYQVKRDVGEMIYYYGNNLEYERNPELNPEFMPDPEMSLDEIERGKLIMEGLTK